MDPKKLYFKLFTLFIEISLANTALNAPLKILSNKAYGEDPRIRIFYVIGGIISFLALQFIMKKEDEMDNESKN